MPGVVPVISDKGGVGKPTTTYHARCWLEGHLSALALSMRSRAGLPFHH
jgi:hypothetical protein